MFNFSPFGAVPPSFGFYPGMPPPFTGSAPKRPAAGNEKPSCLACAGKKVAHVCGRQRVRREAPPAGPAQPEAAAESTWAGPTILSVRDSILKYLPPGVEAKACKRTARDGTKTDVQALVYKPSEDALARHPFPFPAGTRLKAHAELNASRYPYVAAFAQSENQFVTDDVGSRPNHSFAVQETVTGNMMHGPLVWELLESTVTKDRETHRRAVEDQTIKPLRREIDALRKDNTQLRRSLPPASPPRIPLPAPRPPHRPASFSPPRDLCSQLLIPLISACSCRLPDNLPSAPPSRRPRCSVGC